MLRVSVPSSFGQLHAARMVTRFLAGLLAASALVPPSGCAEGEPTDASDADPAIARYRDWRARGAVDEVKASQLTGWRRLPQKRDASPTSLEDEVAALLQTLRLADEAPQPLDATLAQRVREAEERVLEQALRANARAAAQAPTKDEISLLVRERPKAFQRPQLMRLRNLLVRVEPGTSDAERSDARARADALHAEIAAGADFGTTARRASDSETKARDGRLGWVDPNRLAPELRDAALALAPGEHSSVLASADGWVILACEGVRVADPPGGNEARAAAAARSRNERQAWSELRAALLAEADGDPAFEPLSPRARIRTVAARRARAQGLDTDPTVASRLRWTRAHVVAGDTLHRRAEERAAPVDRGEVRAEYDAHPERWHTFPRTRLRAIRLPRGAESPEPGQPSARDRAEAVRASLAAGERPFPFAARDVSDHPSRPRGGNLGWLGADEIAALGPDVSRAAEKLAVGELSPVVAQADGFWILLAEARDASREIPFEEVEGTLERQLRRRRVQEAAAVISRELRAELELEVVAAPLEAEAGPDGRRSPQTR